MPRNTPPVLISYTEVASWTSTGTSKATGTVTWQTGDVVAVLGGAEANDSLSVPTATGLTFTSRALNVVASTCGTRAATAVAASSGSSAITMTSPSGARQWGFGVWVWRGSDGFDAAVEQHTTGKTANIVHADTHSAACWAIFDFSAGTTGTIAPTPTNQRQKFQGTQYTVTVADLTDQASSGSVAYGFSGGGGTGPYSIAGVAVLGKTVAGTTVHALASLGAGS